MEVPKYTLDFFFDKIRVGLDETQYKNLLKLMLWFEKYREKLFRRRRELVEKERYVIFVFLRKLIRRFSPHPPDPKKEQKYINLYKQLYEGRLTHPQDILKLKKLERDLSYEQVVNARVLARKKTRQEREIERERYQSSGYISAAYNNYYTNAVYSYFTGFWVSEHDEMEKSDSGGLTNHESKGSSDQKTLVEKEEKECGFGKRKVVFIRIDFVRPRARRTP